MFHRVNKITYKEGIVKLKYENICFDFKNCSYFTDNEFISIIDMYDNYIKIPKYNIIYIMFFANNRRNKGVE